MTAEDDLRGEIESQKKRNLEYLKEIQFLKDQFRLGHAQIEKLQAENERLRLGLGAIKISEPTVISAIILKAEIEGYFRGITWEQLDNQYWCPEKDDLRAIFDDFVARRKPFIADKRDCDNFSINFMSHLYDKYDITSIFYCRGLLTGLNKPHALNMVRYVGGWALLDTTLNHAIYDVRQLEVDGYRPQLMLG